MPSERAEPPQRAESPERPPAEAAVRSGRRGVDVVPPEARQFQGQHAGLVTRLLANTVDFLVVVVVLAAGYGAVAVLRFLWNSRTFSFPTPSFGLLLVVGSGITVVYLAGAWVITGRTYGDQLLGLRVVGPGGRPPRIGGALARAVLCVLFPVGLFWVAVSRDNRSAQDVVLRYAVLYDWSQQTGPAASEPQQRIDRHRHEQQ
jgi:uncharacterized RDD family membrane protein YckC